MNGYYSKQPRFWRGLSLVIGLTGVLLWPSAVSAQETESKPTSRSEQPLSWARIDFILNRVNLVPRRANARRARISDVLGIGDALQTFDSSNAELRFNDGSEVRIGSQATFRFTPNTRNFQLTNGTVLLLIPPERGRTTIQTPNAVTGIQGSALFVRYIEETDTTIVGALTDNPDGPMILYTNNGAEQQALYANQVGVVQGDRIIELYEIDSRAFWETSGLAETFDYTEDVGPVVDELDGVRQEIREAIENQEPIDGSNVVENPENFSRPESAAPAEVAEPTDSSTEESGEPTSEGEAEGSGTAGNGSAVVEKPGLTIGGEETEETEGRVIQYEGSPAEEFHNQNKPATPGNDGTSALKPAPLTEAESEDEETAAATGNSDRPNATASPSGTNANQPGVNNPAANSPATNGSGRPEGDRPAIRPGSGGNDRPANNNPPATLGTPTAGGNLIDNPVLPALPNSGTPEIIVPPSIGAGKIPTPPLTPTARPNVPTGGVTPLPGSALQDAKPDKDTNNENEDETAGNGAESANPPVDSSDKPIIEETEATPDNSEAVEAVDPSTVSEDEPDEVAPIAEETVEGTVEGTVEETNTVPSSPDEAEAVDPSPVLEGGSNEAPPIIEETDAALNNPGEAEAVEIPETPEPVRDALVEPDEVTDSETVLPLSGLMEAEVFEDEVVETGVSEVLEDAPLVETIEDPIPVQLEETVPFAVEQVDEATLTNTLGGELR
ncbi:MAG: hypothetical protein DCF25_10945 [Leptolyngbya foveolarum]|uniref:FecR protein domain-containing protein n=1 Tax=Leptolyngbya foveolarum TaxID=47253 RepID=A0A2W4UDX0_9CYAN|nr:MAG: hypothetical protein DCF25_10945 [Leptolyngbya foveolarum]